MVHRERVVNIPRVTTPGLTMRELRNRCQKCRKKFNELNFSRYIRGLTHHLCQSGCACNFNSALATFSKHRVVYVGKTKNALGAARLDCYFDLGRIKRKTHRVFALISTFK